jgi:long-chain acyl-CoA synthetase
MARPHLLGLLEDAARWGEQTALSRRRGLRLESWSWGRLRRTAARIALELEARGVARGDRALLHGPGGPGWVAAFWGCLLRGAIVVPLDVDCPPGILERLAGQVQPRLRIDGPLLEELTNGSDRGEAPIPAPPGLDRGDIAEIVFTSGTTTDPKGVCLTHGNLLANIEPFEEEIRRHARLARLARPLRFLSPLPLTHVYGQISAVFIPPLLGAEVHFPHSLKARELIESVRRRRVNVMPCVPRQLEVLREHVEREARRSGRGPALERALARADGWPWPRRWWAFRHVRRAFGWRFWVFAVGGASLSRETEAFWQRMGYVVLQGYGLTETGALATLNDPFRSDRGSVGRPLPGREVRVDRDGQVLVRGEAVSPGYWREGLQPLAGEDGWLATGDLVERDATGALYFRGRAKEVIVTAAGLNVFPEDLEAALDAQPEVRVSAVVAHEGPNGPEPVAVLLLRDGTDDQAREIMSRANTALSPHQRLRRVLVWPEPDFPRTPGTQKVKKTAVAEWVRARLAEGAGEARGRDPFDPLAPLVAAAGGEVPEALGAKAALSTDLKLDSLGQLELVSALEERYQVDIDESAITPETTLGDLESLLSGGSAPAGAPYPYPRWAHGRLGRGARSVLQALVVLPVARAMCWVAVRGREHVRGLEGPALFVCNHVSMVDGGLVVSALPRRARRRLAIAMQGEILRDWRHPRPGNPWHRRLWGPPLYAATALLFGVYSLPQRSGFRHSFAFAGELVDRGQSLLVFPEGRRTTDGRMQPFLPGIGLLAAGLAVPVVPLRIDGLFDLKQRRRYVARPGEVSITVGAPVRYEAGTDPASITKDLERRMAGLAQASSGRAFISSM